jgi:hypothetical protein
MFGMFPAVGRRGKRRDSKSKAKSQWDETIPQRRDYFCSGTSDAADPKVDARLSSLVFRLIAALSRSIIFSLDNLPIGPSDPLTPVNRK